MESEVSILFPVTSEPPHYHTCTEVIVYISCFAITLLLKCKQQVINHNPQNKWGLLTPISIALSVCRGCGTEEFLVPVQARHYYFHEDLMIHPNSKSIPIMKSNSICSSRQNDGILCTQDSLSGLPSSVGSKNLRFVLPHWQYFQSGLVVLLYTSFTLNPIFHSPFVATPKLSKKERRLLDTYLVTIPTTRTRYQQQQNSVRVSSLQNLYCLV